MSNNDFVKGECRHCGGHLEFPAEATGQTIPCPHCGQMVKLQAGYSTPKTGRGRLAAGLAVVVFGVAGAAIGLFGRHPQPTTETRPPPPMATVLVTNVAKPMVAVATPTNPPVETLLPGEVRTNNFDITGGTMQATPGSSLVYVLGTVRNLSGQQRFGVKVDYALFDAAGQAIGHGTDYESVIDPHGDWDFKALVMESKAVSGRFSGITEQ